MKMCHIFISGFVQGVGFRQFVKRQAIKLGLTGWARNNQDNRVEAIFQGNKEGIEKIISICEKGPFLSEVKDVEVFWENVSEEFESFDILI